MARRLRRSSAGALESRRAGASQGTVASACVPTAVRPQDTASSCCCATGMRLRHCLCLLFHCRSSLRRCLCLVICLDRADRSAAATVAGAGTRSSSAGETAPLPCMSPLPSWRPRKRVCLVSPLPSWPLRHCLCLAVLQPAADTASEAGHKLPQHHRRAQAASAGAEGREACRVRQCGGRREEGPVRQHLCPVIPLPSRR